MTETITSALHMPDIEQTSSDLADMQEQAVSPIAIDTALPSISADSTDSNAPTAPVEPITPVGPDGQPMPEEDELDELIIEDFTIDGICGVY